jgi:hypothetical protein
VTADAHAPHLRRTRALVDDEGCIESIGDLRRFGVPEDERVYAPAAATVKVDQDIGAGDGVLGEDRGEAFGV